MKALTLQVPDELAERLALVSDRVVSVIERGLREVDGPDPSFNGLSEVMDFLAGLPSPEAVLALRPSADMERRVRDLLDRSRAAELTADEEREWAQYAFVEHLVRKAKARAVALSRRPAP